MLLIPDPNTAFMDPFRDVPTLCMIGDAVEPASRRALPPRSAQHRQEGRGLPDEHRHRRPGVFRRRSGVLHLRQYPLRPEQQLRLLLHRLRGRPLEFRPRGKQPRLSPALTRKATSPFRRPITTRTCAPTWCCRCKPAGWTSSASTTKSPPPDSAKLTCASTRCSSPPTG